LAKKTIRYPSATKTNYWMKKTILIVLGLAIALTFVGVLVYQNMPANLEKKESNFSFKKMDKITKIELTNEKGGKAVITKNKKGEWIFGDQYPVGDEPIGLLLEVFNRIETLGPVPVAAVKNVLLEMNQKYFKVAIFTGDDEAEKTYYIGGPTLNNQGTHMIMELDGKMASKPYITYIPGQKAYLTSRFDTDTLHWRSPWIFPYIVPEIDELSVLYHNDNSRSFVIKQETSDSFSIATIDGSKINQPKQAYIQQYLSFYGSISLEAYLNKSLAKDTIPPRGPYCTVTLKTKEGFTQQAILYQKPISDDSRVLFDEQNRPLKYDIEYYYLHFNQKKDFAIVQHYVWNKILRSYQEFFAKPGA
jgi:hypothetical protein